MKWEPLETAPKHIEILGKYKNKKPVKIHYAKGGGEEQPFYEGWFYDAGHSYANITGSPSAWKWKPLPVGEELLGSLSSVTHNVKTSARKKIGKTINLLLVGLVYLLGI